MLPTLAENARVTEARVPDDRARVLVVDDDERNLLAITHVLEDIAEVVVANSGEQALRELLRLEFAVILLDVYMPGIDGYETARMIRARAQTRHIPIVFLSAVNKESEHLMRGYAMGAVDYVFKPVEPVVLRSKVSVFVDLFTMTKEIQRKARQEQELLDANLRANAERLRFERELRLAEQRQTAILESLPILLYLEELGIEPRRPRFVSGNLGALTGYSFDDVEASPGLWAERLHPDDRDRVLGAIAERRAGGAMSVEYRWRCADGRYKHFLDQAVLLRDAGGGAVEYAGTLLDVTDRRELETQLTQARKMDAIGQLTGGIAHDFNNLLAAVLGGLGLIERRIPLDQDQSKIVGMTRHAAEQGAELVKHLLAFSRRQKLDPAPVEIRALATSVTDLLAHTLGGLVQLEWELGDGCACVYADAAQLELALMNLVINARDAMPDGGTVTVSARGESLDSGRPLKDLAAGDYVVLTVRDTGTGIAPEMLEQVMEPFFTTKAVGKGTGLGLSMVYGFARQSGGAVRVESAVGEGTSVEVWLPRTVAPVAASGEAALTAPSAPSAIGLSIMVIDDHDGVRATTAALLQDTGHEVIEAGDGEQALALFRDNPAKFDLIVSDFAMPRLSGAELVRKMRELRPDLPALIITGYAEPHRAAASNADLIVLTKPFEPEQLRHAIAAARASAAQYPEANTR